MKYFIDDVDVTAQINSQFTVPNPDGGVYPSQGTQWFDLLKIINDTPALKDKFFSTGGLHKFTIKSENGQDFNVKMLSRSHYSVRNC